MKTLLRPAVVLLLAVCLLPLLNGCAALQQKKSAAPTFSLADMEVQGIKGLETIFRLHIRVINPDEAPLQLRGLTCTLKVNGKSFATGISDEHVAVPASGTATVPVLVYAGMFELVGPVIELIQNHAQPVKSLQYELTGTVRVGEQGGERIPFSLQGSLPPEK
ncbi:LEA type 2 family protein [Candidatus Electronema sp. JM]|uniref:LEA type 2 family protein n=1 Tax=Candidatus Electronema sp. JM TaxID=3401571 RepID=UPI003AA8285A